MAPREDFDENNLTDLPRAGSSLNSKSLATKPQEAELEHNEPGAVESNSLHTCPALLNDTNLSQSAAAVRAAMLDGLSSVEDFAAGVGKSTRTVNAWIAAGLPTCRIGRTPYVKVAEGRAWLLKPSARLPEARRPGRPRKAA